MKNFNLKLVLIMFALSAFILSSCNNDTTNPVTPTPNAPTAMRATSKDASTIILKWDLSTSESDAGFSGYMLDIAPGAMASVTIAKGQTTYEVTGLTEGTVYTFTLKAKNGTMESVGATIQWSPATRFTQNINSANIQIYESASLFGSGLQFYDPINGAPKVIKVSSASDWNLGLDTRTGGTAIFGSPTQINYNYTGTPKTTQISLDSYPTNDLNTIFDSQALDADPTKFAERLVDLNTLTDNTGLVIICRTQESTGSAWTYAKVLIKYTNGSFLQGNAPDRYIECEVSYQKVAGVPYAL